MIDLLLIIEKAFGRKACESDEVVCDDCYTKMMAKNLKWQDESLKNLIRAGEAEAERDALLRDAYNAEASMMSFATWKLVALQQLRDRQPREGDE